MGNKKHYTVTEAVIELYGEKFISYGIKGDTCRFDDISTDRQRVMSLAEALNREEVEECHFYDIISDEADR